MRTEHRDQNILGDGDVPEDFVYDKTNRHLTKKFSNIVDALTEEEVEALKEFILTKLPEEVEGEESQVWTLPYRTDEWDNLGVIHKVQELAKEHIANTYYLEGAVEPKRFELIRTDGIQKYSQEYPQSYINKNEILYTVVVTATNQTEYEWGQTVYIRNGEGFKPRSRDVLVHRNEEYNDWEIEEPMNGTRLDLVITLREMNMGISYDYPIDQSPITDEEY